MIAKTLIIGTCSATFVLLAAAAWLTFSPPAGVSPVRSASASAIAPKIGATKTTPIIQIVDPAAAIAELHGRSPFDPSRRTFQRTPINTTPPPKPIPPRLLGISENKGVRSALVEWPSSGKVERLEIGANTDQGVVDRIDKNEFVLRTGEQTTVISMFN